MQARRIVGAVGAHADRTAALLERFDEVVLSSNTITGSLPIGGLAAMRFSPYGSTAYAVNGGTLTLIDTAGGQVTGTVDLGTGTAIGVSVTPDGNQVWVTFYNSTSVAVVTTQNNSVQTVVRGRLVSRTGSFFGRS